MADSGDSIRGLESEAPPPLGCSDPVAACLPSEDGISQVTIRFQRRGHELGSRSFGASHSHQPISSPLSPSSSSVKPMQALPISRTFVNQDCAYIESAPNGKAIHSGVISVQQTPPDLACPFDLYLCTTTDPHWNSRSCSAYQRTP